ncbi:rRNA bioproteinsis protein rrp36 [Chamberlinius hualienensis]
MDNDCGDKQVHIRQEISNMTFEEQLKLKEQLGTKVFNATVYGSKVKAPLKRFKRENKNRPREESSKKRVSDIQPVFNIKPKVFRDPRFDDLSGEFNEETFNKSYEFLKDLRYKEKKIIEQKMKEEIDLEEKTKLKSLHQSMVAKQHSEVKKQKMREDKKQLKQQQKEVLKQGKKPWFQNKSEKRKLELLEKYESLKKSGQLENYMTKKRKKNAAKDKLKLPKL